MIPKPYEENIFICGSSGTGKSTLLEHLLKTYLTVGYIFWVWDINDQYHFTNIVYDLEDLAYRPLIYKVQTGSNDEFIAFIKKANSITHSDGNSYLIVAIEEAQQYAPKYNLPPELASLVRVGRNKKRTFISVSQRPAQIHNDVISNTHHRFIFRLDLPSDIEYMEKWTAIPKEQIQKLPNYYFWYQSPKYQIKQLHEPLKVV